MGHEAGDDDNCIRCGEYAKDGIAWSYEDYDGYGTLTIWGNGNVSKHTMQEAEFNYELMRNINAIVITGNINDIWGLGAVSRFLAKNESLPLESITIEDSVTGTIKANAFMSSSTYTYANLTSVYIGNGIEEIESAAFYPCINLESVYIGDNCKK